MKRILGVLLFSFAMTVLCAQQSMGFRHIDERQGLHSSKVIKFYTDSRGLLWISCLDGLYTFDGYQCSNMSIEYPEYRSHLNTGVVSIVEDKKDNVWLNVTDGILCYHRTTAKMSYHTFYCDSAHTGINFSNPLYVDNKNHLWVFICDPSSLSIIDLNSPDLHRDTITSYGNGFYQVSNKKPFETVRILAGDLWYGYDIIQLDNSGRLAKLETQMTLDKAGERSKIQVHNFYFLNDTILYIATSHGLAKYNRNTGKSIFYTTHEGKEITQVNSLAAVGETLYVATQQNGLLVFDFHTDKYIAQYLHDATDPYSISGNEINTLYVDAQRNLFLGVNGTGIDYCNLNLPRLNVRYSDNLPEKKKESISFNAFSAFGFANILAGTSKNGLLLLDSNKNIISEWNTTNSSIPSDNVTALFQATPTKTIIGSDNGLAVFDHIARLFSPIVPDLKARPYYSEPRINFIARMNEREIGICTPSGFFIVDSSLEKVKSLDTLNKELYANYSSFCPISDKKMLVNTDGSYCYLMKIELGRWTIKKKIENFASVFDYLPIDSNHFWLATSRGLQLLNLTNLSYTSIQFPMDVKCYSIVLKDSVLWMSSNKGLISYQPASHRFLLYDERESAVNKGFNPHSVFLGHNGEIILGGEKGMNFFRPFELTFSSQYLSPRIQNILVNDIPFPFDSNTNEVKSLGFSYDQNTVTFQFSTIGFDYSEEYTAQYFLEGYDKSPVSTLASGYVRYARLPAGNYLFHLKVFSGRDPARSSEKIIAIHIAPPFYQTWWFRLISFLLVVGIIYAIFKYRIDAVRKEEMQKTAYNKSLAEMESRALRSQMNPHFIFNSLNAIQRYIYQNDVEKSANYLTRFARLMRQILENSKVPFISLQEEIKSLETYIELEKMRFENKFLSSITIDDKIEPDHILIPPLLLQPYVENAIWHGLMHKEVAGLLSIDIALDGSNLVVKIEDNGVGRFAASKFKTKLDKHESTALKATQERLLLIERTTGQKVVVELIDLIDDFGTARGTRVMISMPILET